MVELGRGVEARAGRHLGDRRLGGGQLEAAGAAAVDDLELGDLAHRRHGRRAPLGELGGRVALHEADRRTAQALARRPVADAGDLALVGHQRDQVDLRPARHVAGQLQGLLGGVDR